jgi:hypothetical protein
MLEDAAWISQQFGAANLGDARRSRRAVKVAADMLRVPKEGLPTQTHTWGNLKAAYRLLNCPDITRCKLMEPHFANTRALAAVRPVTLFIQDTTELDFTHMEYADGYGPIGNHKGNGLFAHSLLAMTPDSEVLGLAAQHSWARSTGPTFKGRETRIQRAKRENKESEVWPKVVESVGAVPKNCRWVSVGDRGSDSFDYWKRATSIGWQCLSRVFTNRCTDNNAHLLTQARAMPAQASYDVSQRARPGQAARTLHLNLAWQTVHVCPPKNGSNYAKDDYLEASVVRCWDPTFNVEWLLLATWKVSCQEDAKQCVEWYEQRWRIEEFHKCLKTGCKIESSQLKQANSVDVLLGFSSIIAMRLLSLALLARAKPNTSAMGEIDPTYLKVLCAMRRIAPESLTVRGYWREIARMGGFLARTSDGDPGWQTLWKGLMRLEVWVEAWVDGYKSGAKGG